MPRDISPEELAGLGFLISGQVMDNGETRVRCIKPDGSGYIWTEPPTDEVPAWQNTHFYKGIRETYIVDKGTVAFAVEYAIRHRKVTLYTSGEVFTSILDEPHNVYIFSGGAIHTVKHGSPVGNPEKGGADWYEADTAFDAWTKALSEDEMTELDAKNT